MSRRSVLLVVFVVLVMIRAFGSPQLDGPSARQRNRRRWLTEPLAQVSAFSSFRGFSVDTDLRPVNEIVGGEPQVSAFSSFLDFSCDTAFGPPQLNGR